MQCDRWCDFAETLAKAGSKEKLTRTKWWAMKPDFGEGRSCEAESDQRGPSPGPFSFHRFPMDDSFLSLLNSLFLKKKKKNLLNMKNQLISSLLTLPLFFLSLSPFSCKSFYFICKSPLGGESFVSFHRSFFPPAPNFWSTINEFLGLCFALLLLFFFA